MKESKRYKVYKGIDLEDGRPTTYLLDTKKNVVAISTTFWGDEEEVNSMKKNVDCFVFVSLEPRQKSIDKAILIGEF